MRVIITGGAGFIGERSLTIWPVPATRSCS